MAGKKRPGPKADTLKIDADWVEALSHALKLDRPEGGWPKPGESEANEDKLAAKK